MSPRRLFALFVVFLLGCSRSPQHDFENGVAFFKAEKFSKAESCFARAIAGGTPTAQALNFLGVCKLNEGKTDEAIQSFQDALKLDPAHTAARQNLGLAYVEQDKPDDAIPQLRQVPTAQYELGLVYLHAAAWAQAKQLLQKSGDSPDALNSLGVANAHLGNYRDAKADFEKCITAAPDFATAYLNLAIVEHRHLDLKNTALKHYQRFLELQPKREDVHLLAAQLEQDLAVKPKPVETVAATPPPPPKPVEQPKPAPPVEQPAPPKVETPAPAPPPVVVTPPPAPVIKHRVPIPARTLKAGSRAKAQTYFTEGLLLQKQNKLAAAIASYGKSVSADPTFASAYYNLAIAYRDSNQPDRALDNYELALMASPKLSSARINYAILLQQEGYTADAVREYESYLQDTPNDASVHWAVATLYARDRDTRDKARQHYQAYLKLMPNTPLARDVRTWLEKNP
jgi:tetratricopeptide (TPR) repeat protein